MDTALKIRKSLTPPRGVRAAFGSPEMRREIRREVSERVTLRCGESVLEGWTLNLSRGGVRVIVEQPVELGDAVDVLVGTGEASSLARTGRVVWFQEESDGYIAGIAFQPPLHVAQ